MFVYFNGLKLPVEDKLVRGYVLSIQKCPDSIYHYEPQSVEREIYFTSYPNEQQIIEELSKADCIYGIAIVHECWSLV